MTIATQNEIKIIGIGCVSIDGQKIHPGVLIAAALQDTDHVQTSAEIAVDTGSRGNLGFRVRPNGESELASRYRDICRELLPIAESRRDAAYADYCGSHVSDRRHDGVHAIGHGSWVSGPDPAKQSRWMAWDQLYRALSIAAK